MSAAGWARGRILAALAFLAWLDDRGTTLGAATQADVDDWLHSATRQHYLLRDFLTWASARRLADKITVPALPRSELAGLITEDSGWQLLSRCLRDPGIPLDVRAAGALLLLYGQFVSRLARLTAADIEQHGPDASLHGLWAPALQRMQHFEHARAWKPCPRRLSLDPVTGRPPPDERSGSGPAPASGRRPAPAMTRSIARLEKAGLRLRSLDPALRSSRAGVSQVPPQSW